MSRHLGPKCKLCRRSRVKLFLKGERCHTAKCAIEKRNVPPGPQGNMQKKMGEYAIRLREKQKMRFFYGVSERQMQGYFERASRAKGVTGYNLVSLFERRLDNILHRSGLAASRQDARQMVVHGHFRINARKVSIPSQLLKVGDEVAVSMNGSEILQARFNAMKEKTMPAWLQFDATAQVIKFLYLPERSEIDVPVEDQLIVEYYSR